MPSDPDYDAVQRFRGLLDVAPDAMVVSDRSGHILLANAQAERLLGYAPEELIGQPVEVLLPERFRGRHVEHRAAYLSDPRPRAMGAALSLFARRKDGRELPVEISLSPIEDARGPLVIAAIRDTSERRKMQEALRLSEDRLRLLVDSVREYAIFMLDAEGRIQTWNAGAERIHGYAAAEIVGKTFSVFYAAPDVASGKPQRELAAALRNRQHREEGWRLRKDGSQFQADVTVTPLLETDGGLRGFAVVTRDVSERKAAEQARERAVRARDEILSLLSHDLGNAVNALSLNTQLLLRLAPSNEREARLYGYGQIVGRSADTMKRLIQDLLDLQRIEQGRFSIEPRPEDVVPLVEEAVEPMRALAEERSIALETRLDRASGTTLCDRDRILQVLQNLIGNAIKFVPEGGRVTVETGPTLSQVRFAVADNGPGIPPEDLPRVFDRHWQGASPAFRRGSGLGLFIVKTIVEAHAGRTWVESTPGTGASFFFTLPARAPRASAS
jgi:PAS domain S-box-containing protein